MRVLRKLPVIVVIVSAFTLSSSVDRQNLLWLGGISALAVIAQKSKIV